LHDEVKKVVWFNTSLWQSGGGERLSLEVVQGFRRQGIDAYYVVFTYDKDAVFNGRYHNDFIIWKETGKPMRSKWPLLSLFKKIQWLRKKLKEMSPDVVITQGTWGQASYLFLATLFTGIPYLVHVFGSVFAFPPASDLTKYSFVFRKHFHEIRNSVESYRQMVPERMPPIGVKAWLKNELHSLIKYLAIKKAKKIFVLSRRNGWEVAKLYGRKAVVLKGAFPLSIFDYVPKVDVKKKFELEGQRMVLSLCRLSVNKRIDLCIRAFVHLSKKMDDVVLIVGGAGPEEEQLKNIVNELDAAPKVKFVGYVPDGELWDYFTACDVFVSLDLADFDIAPFEALALGRKVIWANEMEMDNGMLEIQALFPVNPNMIDVSNCIERALNTPINKEHTKKNKSILSSYSWEEYTRSMLIK